jgi:hypothetical protein
MLSAADTTSWYIGLSIGLIVVAVAATIVVTILVLAARIARQAETANEAIKRVGAQTDDLGGIAKINGSGVRILHSARALRKAAVGH